MFITKHALERAKERGLPNSLFQKAVRSLSNRPDGVYTQPTGHGIVVQNNTVVTVLSPGMSWEGK